MPRIHSHDVASKFVGIIRDKYKKYTVNHLTRVDSVRYGHITSFVVTADLIEVDL
jgi:hypothetical protein